MIDKVKLLAAIGKVHMGIGEIGLAIGDADPTDPEDRHLLTGLMGEVREVIADLTKVVNKVPPRSLN
jgi:hypothetical protein